MPWANVATLLVDHGAPLLLEVHPPNRPRPEELLAATTEALAVAPEAPPARAPTV